MAKNKKEWGRPELIILMRHTPEEAVLNGCKGGLEHSSFLSHHLNCHSDTDCTNICQGQFTSEF